MRVAVAAHGGEAARTRGFDINDIEVLHAPPEPGGPYRWFGRGFYEQRLAHALLRAALHDFTPDLIWERYSLFGDAVRHHRPKVPHLLEVNAPLALERTGRATLRNRYFEQRIFRSADRVAAVSGWLTVHALRLGVPAARVRHVPNGSDVRPSPDRDALRERYGLTGLVVGFHGSMRRWHGVDRLGAILDALPEATVVTAGDGPERPPEHPRLRHLGRLTPDELPGWLAAIDVAVAPYRTDTPPWFCPLKLTDYAAAGVPFVTSNTTEARRIAGPSDRCVGTDDPRAWAAAIREVAGLARIPRPRPWTQVIDEALDGWVDG